MRGENLNTTTLLSIIIHPKHYNIIFIFSSSHSETLIVRSIYVTILSLLLYNVKLYCYLINLEKEMGFIAFASHKPHYKYSSLVCVVPCAV